MELGEHKLYKKTAHGSHMAVIHLRTAIPGPKSKALLRQKEKEVSDGIDIAVPVFAREAKGATLTDIDGNTFLDFAGGIGATNSGHGNQRIIHAIQQQARKFLHTCFPVVPYRNYVELCKALNRITPGDHRKKTVLFNSGAEAVENAIKIARKYTGRTAIVSFEHGFHGRTLLTMGLTGKMKPYKLGFGPFAPEIYKLEYPYMYRRPSDCLTEEHYVDYLIEHIEEDFFTAVVNPENIAAVIMEPVTGEGGFIVPPKSYVQKLHRLCRKNGILFVVDEVQTGFGRTGKLFAIEHFGVEPDIITMAKSLSNGMPVSAVTGRKEIMDCVQPGGLGGTFSGNPVSCAAALEAIDFILKNKLWKKAEQIGRIVMQHFKALEQQSSIVGEARGLGAMCALEIVRKKKTKEPDKEMTKKIVQECYRNGLIVLSSGILGNDIRTLMPLTIRQPELEEGLQVLEHAVLRHSGKR